jgi:hypothetical protein
MVTASWPNVCLRIVAVSGLLAVSACSSFDPIEVPRYTLLVPENFDKLGIADAHWIAYDDQHSVTAACTNGAAGDHLPSECSLLLKDPPFTWDGPKCPPSAESLSEGEIAPLEANGSICITGELRPLSHCVHPQAQCYDTTDGGDVSNMWGAGVGLSFSASGKEPWDAGKHGVKGVAFDLSGVEESQLGGSGFNLRVEVPIVLDGKTKIPSDRPLMRDDGSVLGLDGKLYGCNSGQITEPTTTPSPELSAVRADPDSQTVLTSEQHPFGSAFWQTPKTQLWGPSPVQIGHNEFDWPAVAPPPESQNTQHFVPYYSFDKSQVLGVHFQVVHPTPSNQSTVSFHFCIKNLALLLE